MSKKSKKKLSPKQTFSVPELPESVAIGAEISVSHATQKSFIQNYLRHKSAWAMALFLFVGCVIIYWQTRTFEFINFDDNLYVYQNPNVTSGVSWQNFMWALTAFHSANWHPLTWLSHQLDVSLFGVNSGTHHLTNLFWHALNAIFLFFTLRKLTASTWRSAIVAAIFAFHPTHVESVAWVSERKDVLSAFFMILTVWFYIDFVRNGRNVRDYFFVFIALALGLMAKPMLVTLPFVLILLDYWALKRFEKFELKSILPLFVEKIPLFALTVFSATLTYFAQKSSGAMYLQTVIPFPTRLVNAFVSYIKYVVMFFYPLDLGGWYPYQEVFPLWQIIGAILLFTAITIYVLSQTQRRKYLFGGWFWFVGTLVPVIGLVQVGGQGLADRYTYIPFIGLSIAVVWWLAEICTKLKMNKDLIGIVSIAICLIFIVLSYRQTSFWQNNETFYRQSLAATSRNYVFAQNYCQYLLEQNRLDEAETQCEDSITTNPNYNNAHLSLGVIQFKKGNLAGARQSFERAWELKPDDLAAFSNLTNALIALDRLDEAAEKVEFIEKSEVAKAVEKTVLFPNYRLLSLAFAEKNKNEKALEYALKALKIEENRVDMQTHLNIILHRQGKSAEAMQNLREAIQKNPNQADFYNALGLILKDQNKIEEARQNFQKALQLNPNFRPAIENLKNLPANK